MKAVIRNEQYCCRRSEKNVKTISVEQMTGIIQCFIFISLHFGLDYSREN